MYAERVSTHRDHDNASHLPSLPGDLAVDKAQEKSNLWVWEANLFLYHRFGGKRASPRFQIYGKGGGGDIKYVL